MAKRRSSKNTGRRSPYFVDPSKRLKKQQKIVDDLDSNSLAVSPWVITRDLPLHLVGDKYFDVKENGDITLVRRTNTPEDFSLSQAICSYGYFCLAPNRWVPGRSTIGKTKGGSDDDDDDDDDEKGYLVRPLTYRKFGGNTQSVSKTAVVAIGLDTQTKSVVMAIHASVDQENIPELTTQVDRMLRLEASLEAFHELYPEAKERGFGRLYRSPTLFEDMVKSITNCNMKWGGTVEMNAKLCRHVGSQGAFPSPEEIHGVGADFLKEHCRVGYRDKYIWNLAKDIVEGKLDLVRDLGSTPSGACRHSREHVEKKLLKMHGIGQFAANNILQLMGYFNTHPYDTETVRLWKEDFGAAGSATKAEVFREARAHYAKYEPYAFVAYWFDLWKNYERRAGARSPSWRIEQFETERPSGAEEDHNRVFAHPPSPTRKRSSKNKSTPEVQS